MKILEGNPGRRPLNKKEPKPTGMPTCPRHLSKEAKAEWRRIAKELKTIGLLTTVDRAALAAYCQHWAHWVEAEQKLQEDGISLVYRSPGGMYRKNPWLQVADEAMKGMLSFLGEFGMTPSSRTRIQVEKPQAEADPLAALTDRAKAANG